MAFLLYEYDFPEAAVHSNISISRDITSVLLTLVVFLYTYA